MAFSEKVLGHYRSLLNELPEQERPDAIESIVAAHSDEADRRNVMGLDELREITKQRRAVADAEASKRTLLGTAGDVGISLAKGAIGLGESAVGLANIPTFGYAGKALEQVGYDPQRARKDLDTLLSPAQQHANKKVDQAHGFWNTAKAMVENPSTIGMAAVESAPSMIGAGGAARAIMTKAPTLASGVAALASRLKASPEILAGAIGEGLVSMGQQAEQTRQETADRTLSAKQIAMAAGAGLGTAAFGFVGGKLADKLGFADVDTMLAGAGIKKNAQGVIKNIIGGGISEGVFEELPQSVQEQIWANAALDKPLLEGVPEAAAQGMLVGGLMGGGSNLVSSFGSERDDADQPPPGAADTETDSQPVDLDAPSVENGPEYVGPRSDANAAPASPEEAILLNENERGMSPEDLLGVPPDLTQAPPANPPGLSTPKDVALSPGNQGKVQAQAAALQKKIKNLESVKKRSPKQEENLNKFQDELDELKSFAGLTIDDAPASPPQAQGQAQAPVEAPKKLSPRDQKARIENQAKIDQMSADEKAGEESAEPKETPPAKAVKAQVDQAHEAATSPKNDKPQPTEKQIEAGNYEKGHIKIDGHDLSVENPAGSTRSGTAPDGQKWSVTMKHDYGYIKRTEGADGDHIDVFSKAGTTTSPKVFVVDQVDPKTGKFDEHKVIMGSDSETDARQVYLDNYEKGWGGLGAITEMGADEFKAWTKEGTQKKPVAKLNGKGPVATGEAAQAEKTPMSSQAPIAVGDRVTWTGKGGSTMEGTTIKKNGKSFQVKTDDGKLYAPSLQKLSKLSAGEAPAQSPPPQSVVASSSAPVGGARTIKTETERMDAAKVTPEGFKLYSYEVSGETKRVIEHPNGSKLIEGVDSTGEKYHEFEGPMSDFGKYVHTAKDGTLEFNDKAIRQLFDRQDQADAPIAQAVTPQVQADGGPINQQLNKNTEQAQPDNTTLRNSDGGESSKPAQALNKEPWELTRSEYSKTRDKVKNKKRDTQWAALKRILGQNQKDGRREGLITTPQWESFIKKYGNPDPVINDKFHFFDDAAGAGKIIKPALSTEERQHYNVVRQAQAEGKQIPHEVLADYPDLAQSQPVATEKSPPRLSEKRTTEKPGELAATGQGEQSEHSEPSIEDINSGKAFTDSTILKIDEWVNRATNNGDRPIDQKWEIGAVKRFVESELHVLMKGKRSGAWASAKIAAAKASSFEELKAAIQKINPVDVNETPTRDKQGERPSPFSGEVSAEKLETTPDQHGDTVNPKVSKLVAALRNAGVETTMSGDFYGNDLVYVDVEQPPVGELPDGWVLTHKHTTLTSRDVLGEAVPDNQKAITANVEKHDEKKRIARKGAAPVSDMDIEKLVAAFQEKPQAANKPEKTKKEFGANNKIFTKDAADAARELLKKKLNQLNTGLDPEIIQAGIQLAGYNIEAGARSFVDYAKTMVADLGDVVKPYLRGWYEAVRYYPGFDSTGMTKAEDINEDFLTSEDGADKVVSKSGDKNVNQDEPAGKKEETHGPIRTTEEGLSEGERSEAVQGTPVVEGIEQPLREGEPAGGQKTAATDTKRDDGARGGRSGKSGNLPAVNDYRITGKDSLGKGGPKKKYADNIAAIRLLSELKDRKPTVDEQAVLVKYVGWGGLNQAFYRPDGSVAKGWAAEAKELKALLSDEEYTSARSTTQDAHYTSEAIVRGVYDGLKRIGFTGGKTLEPAVGTGNFIGMMPAGVRNKSKITGVEIDPITSAIASHLYPKQNIVQSGFQDFMLADNSFDLAIGNPPFGSKTLFDPHNKDLSKFSIHNYFFAKSIKALRPNGILAMVVSSSMMDKQGGAQRQWINARAELLGAIRLPNNAFRENAGTDVTTDIIFLRKRVDGETAAGGNQWQGLKQVAGVDGTHYNINEYFVEHPEMMLGHVAPNKLFPGEVVNGVYDAIPGMIAKDGVKIETAIAEAIQNLPEGVYVKGETFEAVQRPDIVVSDIGFAQPYGYTIDDNGQAVRRLPDINGEKIFTPVLYGEKPLEGLRLERFKGLMGIRDAVRTLIRAELSDDTRMEEHRKTLNKLYDAFVSKHGVLSTPANSGVLPADPIDMPLLLSLEMNFDKGISASAAKKKGVKPVAPSAKKATIFRQRTREPYRAATTAKDAKEALAVVLRESGTVDISRMARLTGLGEDAIEEDLSGIVFHNPATESFETAETCLSGNVKKKLAEAKKSGPRYLANVKALESVQPEDVPPELMSFRIGATWIPAETYEAFANDVLKNSVDLRYSEKVGLWSVNADKKSVSPFDTEAMKGVKIFEHLLTNRDIAIYEQGPDNTRVFNMDATTVAKAKADEMDRAFSEWVLSDINRRESVASLFNDKVNTTVESKYDGAHMIFPGMGIVNSNATRDNQLRVHQKNVVWRLIQKGKGLLDHVVGSGKTFASIAAGIEMKRMGLLKKPMYVVPNHLVAQWASDFQRLYPGANVLVIGKKDFAKQKRQEFMGRIATGSWDAVLMAHSSFGFVPSPREYELQFYKEQLEDFEEAIRVMTEEEGGKTKTVKEMENARDRMKEKMKALADRPKDATVDFSELGVDGIFVDEAHEFKNLFYVTKRTRVAGLGNTTGSQKAFDMFVKTQYLQDVNNGKGVFFMTGTPVSNSIAEMYTMQRFLDYDNLKSLGIRHFDQWANMFASTNSDWEIDPTGTRFRLQAKLDFVNVPGLMAYYKDFADIVSTEDLQKIAKNNGQIWPIPGLKGGKPENVVAERSDLQKSFMEWIVYRFENFPKDPKIDNPLKATGEAMKASLDIRLINPALPDNPGSKVNLCVNNVISTYNKWKSRRGTQLVFCDLSVPKSGRSKQQKEISALQAEIKALDQQLADDRLSDEKRADIEDEYGKLLEKMEKFSYADIVACESTFSVYDDVKAKLIANGVKESEIAFIHDANTDNQKEELFSRVRAGHVRVLLGSTAKMGAGMNVQNKLVALHHLDAPWRPSDLEQREGRIIRQGNEFFEEMQNGGEKFEIEIFRYSTKETLDTRRWQVIERKAVNIGQLRSGGVKWGEKLEDATGEASNAAEMKAAASGNPLILKEITLRQELSKLEALRSWFRSQKYAFERTIAHAERIKAQLPGKLSDIKKDLKILEANPKDHSPEKWAVSLNEKLFKADGLVPVPAEIESEDKDALKANKKEITAAVEANKTALKTAKESFASEFKKAAERFVKDRGNVSIEYRGITFDAAAYGSKHFHLTPMFAYGGLDSEIVMGLDDNFGPGFMMRLDNLLNKAVDTLRYEPEAIKAEIKRTQQNAEVARKKMAESFDGDAKIEEIRAEHASTLAELNQQTANQPKEKQDFSMWEGGRSAPEDLPSENRQAGGKREYYIYDHGNGFVPAPENSKAIDIAKGVETFASRKEDGQWVISEATSGAAMSHAGTRAEAVKIAKDRLEQVGIEKFKETLAGLIEKNGVSPWATGNKGPVYATNSRMKFTDSGITLSDIQKTFRGQHVGLNADGSVWVKFKGGGGVQIKSVQQISADKLSFEVAYGRMLGEGEFIAGKYEAGTIELQRDMADRFTLSHESFHHLERSGMLTRVDIDALDRAVRKESGGKIQTPTEEDRAKYVETKLRDRANQPRVFRAVLQKIADFIDSVVNLFHATARGVVRGMESGKVYNKEILPEKTISGETINYVSSERLGRAFGVFDGDKIYVREDLPVAIARFVAEHEDQHRKDFQNLKTGGWITSEIRANYFPGIKDPVGLIKTIMKSITPSRLNFYLERAKNNGAVFSTKQLETDSKNFTENYENVTKSGTDLFGAKTVSSRVKADFEAAKGVSLKGTQVKTFSDIAFAAQVYRDPRYETFRLFYLKGGTIIDHEGFTSKMPGMAPAFKGAAVTTDDSVFDHQAARDTAIAQIKDHMKAVGADGYVLLHNHPGGDPRPSPDDIKTTRTYSQNIPGFKGHVIINSGTYAVITGKHVAGPAISTQEYTARPVPGVDEKWEDPLFAKNQPGDIAGRKIARISDVAKVAQELKNKTGYATLFYLNAKNVINGVQELPVESLTNRPIDDMHEFLLEQSRRHGSVRVIAHVFESKQADKFLDTRLSKLIDDGSLFDAVYQNQDAAGKWDWSHAKEPGQVPTKLFGRTEFPSDVVREDSTAPIDDEAKQSTAGIKRGGPQISELAKDGKSLLQKAGKAHGFQVTDRDLKWWNKIFEVPYVLAKKFPNSMGRLLKTEMESSETRAQMLEKDYAEKLGAVQDSFKKDKKAVKALQDLIWKWEGERFPEKAVPTDWFGEDELGELNINTEHYDEVRAFLKKEGVSSKVIDGFIAIREKLDSKWIDAFYTMKTDKIDPTLIEEYRGALDKIHNYFPHRRAGNIQVSVYDRDEKKVVYSKHYYNFTGKAFSRVNKSQSEKAAKWLTQAIASGALPGDASRYELLQPKKVTNMPQEAFFQINMEGMQQVLGVAGEELGKSRVEYEAERLYNKEGRTMEEARELAKKRLNADMEKALSKAVADVFKAQGWGAHAINRKGTPGFVEDDIFGTLFEYLSGYAGFKTKMDRARAHSKVLVELDAKANPNEYRYAARYVKDMLANQDLTDRVVDMVRGAFFVKYLGFVVKSGLVNLTQNVVMAGPVLSMHTKNSHIKLGKAMADTRRALTSKAAWTGQGVSFPNLTKNEQKALYELHEKGATTDQYLRELKGNIPGVGWGRYVKKVINTSGLFMQVAERFNRASTGLAAYRVGIEKGMNHNAAVEFAKDIVYDSHFLYGKHNLPEMARGSAKALRAAYTFRSFTHNYVDMMAHMVTNQGADGKKAAARSFLNLLTIGGLTSMPFFGAVAGALMWALGADDDDDPMTEIRAMMPDPFTRDLVSHGLIGAVAGADITGSIAIEVPQKWSDIIGVPYSVGEDIYNTVSSLRAGNTYRAISETPFTPMVMKNAMRGIELFTTGQRSRSGKDINYPGEVGARKITEGEAIMKAGLGLQPLSVSKGYSAYQATGKLKESISEKKRAWADRWVNAARRGDKREQNLIDREIRAWNQKARSDGKTYRVVDIKRMIKSRMSEDNLRGTPKAMRSRVKDIAAGWK